MSWLAHCMDAGRRQETLGSETKDFVTHHPVGSMSFMSATVSLVPPPPHTPLSWWEDDVEVDPGGVYTQLVCAIAWDPHT